jgi:hypothetical protein
MDVPPEAAQGRLRYRNHRGEVGERRVCTEAGADGLCVWYGSTEWHPERQWFLRAIDVDKGELRDFAMADILEWSR